MSEGRKSAETAAAAVLRVLSANPGDAGVDAAAEIIEIALHNAGREQEKRELQRVADVQASAHAHLSRLLNASPAVIYCRRGKRRLRTDLRQRQRHQAVRLHAGRISQQPVSLA